ncbi:hypothetical protein ACB098_04G099300 [Castanea mollissima]
MQLLMEKQASSMTPQTHAQFRTLSPIKKLKLSYTHDGSTLYDSFELRAITHQLNKAIQASNVSSPPYLCHLKNSPFYRQQLGHIYKENAQTSQRASSSLPAHAVLDKRMSMAETNKGSGGFVTQLWKKVKQGLLRNKQKKDH